MLEAALIRVRESGKPDISFLSGKKEGIKRVSGEQEVVGTRKNIRQDEEKEKLVLSS